MLVRTRTRPNSKGIASGPRPFGARSVGLKIFWRRRSAAFPVRKRQHQRPLSREPGPLFFNLSSVVQHHVGSLVDNIYFPSLARPPPPPPCPLPLFFSFAFITAAHRHALWVNCHLCFAYGAMKRKQ